ncbi:hypothetical protein D3C80_1397210 [compost metagenome]
MENFAYVVLGEGAVRVGQMVVFVIQSSGDAVRTDMQRVRIAQPCAGIEAQRPRLVVYAGIATPVDDEVAAVLIANLAMAGLYPSAAIMQFPMGTVRTDDSAARVEAVPRFAALLQRLGVFHNQGQANVWSTCVHVRTVSRTRGGLRSSGCSRKLVHPNCEPEPSACPRLKGGTSFSRSPSSRSQGVWSRRR